MQRLQPDRHGDANLGESLREELAEAARICARMGLVEGFGHVSARREGGGFMITSTRPMITAQPGDLIEVDEDGGLESGDASIMPLETPVHAAVYRARTDVGAVCRTHSPHAAGWGAREEIPPLILGLEGLSGEIALHHQPDLITDAAAADAAAADLGDADCLLIHSNGMVCTGRDLKEALVRAWFLEQRSATADRTPDAPALPEPVARDRARHYSAEAARAWNWIATRFGEGAA